MEILNIMLLCYYFSGRKWNQYKLMGMVTCSRSGEWGRIRRIQNPSHISPPLLDRCLWKRERIRHIFPALFFNLYIEVRNIRNLIWLIFLFSFLLSCSARKKGCVQRFVYLRCWISEVYLLIVNRSDHFVLLFLLLSLYYDHILF